MFFKIIINIVNIKIIININNRKITINCIIITCIYCINISPETRERHAALLVFLTRRVVTTRRGPE